MNSVFTLLILVSFTLVASVDKIEEITQPSRTIDDHCIVLMGGRNRVASVYEIEYYHPDANTECDDKRCDLQWGNRLRGQKACYLRSTGEIVSTDAEPSVSMVYSLKNHSLRRASTSETRRATSGGTATASVAGNHCISCGGTLLSMNLSEEPDPTNTCEVYNASDAQQVFNVSKPQAMWKPMTPMPSKIFGGVALSLTDNDFYVVGGSATYRNMRSCKTLYRYDLNEHRWYSEPPMITDRCRFHDAAAISSTEMIICGGWSTDDDPNRSAHSSECEIYNSTTKQWRLAASMNVGRTWHSMINFKGDVYAIGGGSDDGTVERYNKTANSWTLIKPLKKGNREFFFAFVF